MQGWAVDADCDVLARAGFPSAAAPPLVSAVRGSHHLLLTDTTGYITTAALTTVDVATAAAAANCDKNIVQESAKTSHNSDRDEGTGGEGGGAMRGIVGLLPF